VSVAGLIGLIAFALGVAGSIALHEVGHLVPAKRFGVRVTQYMVGFGPTVWSKLKGETEYGVKAIPLGGYIRMVGMFPPRVGADGQLVAVASSTGPLQSLVEDARRSSMSEIKVGEEHRAFYQLSVSKKVVVMLGGPTMNLLLAAVFYSLALVAVGVPTLTMTIDRIAPCVPAAGEVKCQAGDPPSPASESNLQPGDQVLAVDGVTYDDWSAVVKVIRGMPGQNIVLTVDRDGRQFDVPITVATAVLPDPDHPTNDVTSGYIGLSPTVEQQHTAITAVPGRMWDFAATSAGAVASIPSKLPAVWQAAFGNQERDPTGPVSVVGVGRFSSEVAQDQASFGWKVANILLILAALNMALFLFNLIPLLPLDGGHIAGALYEGGRRKAAKLRGRPDPGPVDVARMLPVAYTVAFVLIGMSGLLIYADIVNPIKLGG
jgi:membrane-associated protease RseP (regulator of RpoE activity)